MYVGVPTVIPVCVSVSPPAIVTARAIPKSASIAREPSSRMFSGLMSRWMTLRAWAKSSASATWRVMSIASSIGSCDRSSSRSRSDLPSTNGIT